MSFEEVLSIIGMDAEPLFRKQQRQVVQMDRQQRFKHYRPFENQVLVRKSGMIVAADKGIPLRTKGTRTRRRRRIQGF